MESNRNLILILAKGASSRIPKKNLVDICGKPMLAYVIEIAKHAESQAIVVSTDCDEIADVALQQGVSIVMRKAEWELGAFGCTGNNLIENSIDEYLLVHTRRHSVEAVFDTCTVLLGNTMFLRPSWIRMAKTLLHNKMLHKNSPLTHVCLRDYNGAFCFRLGNIAFSNPIYVQHFGLNIDIDYPVDLELARSVVRQIQAGEIDYSLDESVHEDADKIGRAVERDLYYPVGISTIV